MRAAAKYERVYRDFLQEMRQECPGIRYAYIFYRPLPFQLRKGQAIMAFMMPKPAYRGGVSWSAGLGLTGLCCASRSCWTAATSRRWATRHGATRSMSDASSCATTHPIPDAF